MRTRIVLKNLFGSIKTPDSDHRMSGNNDFELDFIGLSLLLKNNIRPLAVAVTIVMAVTSLLLFSLPDTYTSTASILPSGNNDRLSALKELAGVAGTDRTPDARSSMLFPSIMQSNQIRDAVIDNSYTIRDDGQPREINLKGYFGTNNKDALRSLLAEITEIETVKETGVIHLSVETEYPELSQAIADSYLTELDRFNMYQRQSSAGQHVKYLEREIAKNREELNRLEDSLETFQMTNRNWDLTADPAILKTLNRLKRDLEIKSKTYALLNEQYALARLDAQKDIPIVQVLDHPSLPEMKSGPYRIRIIILSGLVAFVIMSFIIFMIDTTRRRNNSVRTESEIPAFKRKVKISGGISR